MRAKLEAMGPVNMMALEEYRETAERHTFLDTQRKDLISSIENRCNYPRDRRSLAPEVSGSLRQDQ